MNRRLSLTAACVALAAVLSLAGCDSPEEFAFDELDLTPAQEELVEYPLGKYIVPIPLSEEAAAGAAVKRNQLEFAFALHALVTSEGKKQLARVWKRNEGALRDQVIRVFRDARLDELQEPEMITLKSHLMDVLEERFGEHCVRRLLISEVRSRKL